MILGGCSVVAWWGRNYDTGRLLSRGRTWLPGGRRGDAVVLCNFELGMVDGGDEKGVMMGGWLVVEKKGG